MAGSTGAMLPGRKHGQYQLPTGARATNNVSMVTIVMRSCSPHGAVLLRVSVFIRFVYVSHILRHETSSGLYGTLVFFFCKVAVDLIILRLIPLLVFAPISYFLIGEQH